MSTTYSLLCHDCKVSYWCGQGDSLYSAGGMREYLGMHMNHRLEFVNDLVDRPDDDDESGVFSYTDWESE